MMLEMYNVVKSEDITLPGNYACNNVTLLNGPRTKFQDYNIISTADSTAAKSFNSFIKCLKKVSEE